MYPLQKENGLELIKDNVKDANTSRIYGFILYTDSDPYVKKVLRDDDFWDALDEKSGPNWPIFAVRPITKEKSGIKALSNPKMIGFMVPESERKTSNETILKNFGLSSAKDLPCFVAFMWDDNDKLQSISVPIRGNNIDDCFDSIREIVVLITEAEKKVLPEYKRNVELFHIVADELKALQTRYTIKSIGRITKKFYDFFSSFI